MRGGAALQFLGSDGAVCVQCTRAVSLAAGERLACLRQLQLGACSSQRRVVRPWVDLEQRLAGAHHVALAEQHAVDRPGHTRPQFDLLGGLTIGLEARNVFDEEPPYVNLAPSINGSGGYDATASNPIGRLFALTVNKTW